MMTGHERLKATALADRAEADFPWSSCPPFLRSCIAEGWDDAARETMEKIGALYEQRKRFAEQQ
jgi:hypothetical protein